MENYEKIKFNDFLPENPQRIAFGGLRFKNILKQNLEEKPLISIVTIVLNGEKYLRDTINSVLDQNYSNLEYIIIDGGSTDRTIQIIKEYQDVIDIWYSEPDLGIADAFNKGVSLARGELIGHINADDWYEKNSIKYVVDKLKEEKFDLFCGKLTYWKNEKILCWLQSNPKKMISYMSLPHQAVFLKRSLHVDYGGYSTNYKIAMDYKFLLKIIKNNRKITVSEEKISNMRHGGISSTNIIQTNIEFLEIKNFYFPNRKIYNYLFFLNSGFKLKIKGFLLILGLERFLDFYRRYILPIYRNDVAYK